VTVWNPSSLFVKALVLISERLKHVFWGPYIIINEKPENLEGPTQEEKKRCEYFCVPLLWGCFASIYNSIDMSNLNYVYQLFTKVRLTFLCSKGIVLCPKLLLLNVCVKEVVVFSFCGRYFFSHLDIAPCHIWL
jgi:hypothetical protein